MSAMVASSVLIRRYHQRGVTRSAPTIIRWALIVAFSIGEGALHCCACVLRSGQDYGLKASQRLPEDPLSVKTRSEMPRTASACACVRP